ncbi:RRP8 family class I SAM-dependent methyltransferase [Waltera acetigignens]|uniref:RRP8 family class I SAM-dependent methyltransferase n=1 Tax=Waltera acetigignens TaxID=2981769 RepID=A0AAE3A1H6_9FIRM|nr:RRP8 family class I SAM-dependent methyltransferase [Brotolimicola acetigignens]MCC2119090.1 RRP8 family class I SAM-dependent methyltransferase [Brotolimicola acetigignens]
MKKIIGCPAGEWALKLYTVDRFISLEYLLDEQEGEYGICGFPQRVHSYEYLRNEKIDDLIVIINDTRKYEEIKKKLEKYGLIENIHFFNGWKLDSNFYHEVYADKGWQEFEQSDTNALKRQRQGWKDRARAMSQLIPEDVKVLMDIGCGEELLKEFLCKDIKYYGLDYCERNKETIICDINKEKLPDIKVDLYYMAGIIDYVTDIPNFIKQLSRAKYVVMSKTRNERFIRLDDKVMDSGYMNYGISSYYCSNLITDMFEIGFVCRKMQWNYKQRDEH